MKVGVLGSGTVGQTLAAGFLKHGHEVMIGTREPAKLADWNKANPRPPRQLQRYGGLRRSHRARRQRQAAAAVLRSAGKSNLEGKTVIDYLQPDRRCAAGSWRPAILYRPERISDGATAEGISGRALRQSLQLRRQPADGQSAITAAAFARPCSFAATMTAAKKTVTGILDQFGWETADMGTVEAARAIEPLCMLWCIVGFTQNEWTHAFKLLHK